MALFRNNAEGGTNGTAVTVGNSGGASGDAFTAVTAGFVFSSAQPAHGALGFASPTTAADGLARVAVGTVTAVAVRTYFRTAATVAADNGLIRLAHATDTIAATLFVNTAGALRLSTKGGTVWTADAALPANQTYRLEVYASSGTTAANGTIRAAYYLGDSTTAVYDSGTLTGQNLGGDIGGFTQVRVGKLNAVTSPQFYFDDIAINTGSDATGLIGPVANAAPVVTAGPTQNVAAAATVTLSYTATDSDGTIASRSTTFDYPTSGAPSITGGGTATPSFTAGAAGSLYLVRQTVTDNGGATGSAVTEVRVPVAGATAMRPLPLNGTSIVGTWTAVGATTHGAALADDSDSTYNESAAVSGTAQSYRVRLAPSAVKDTGKVTRRLGTDTGTANATVRLIENNTIRQQWTQALTATPTDYEFTITNPGAIADWGNLYLELSVTS